MLNLSALNPQQRLAVETLRGPVLILAGAGTGKTRVITSRVAYLVEGGVDPGQILAVTFTNKAAREMQERVRELVPRVRSRDHMAGETPRGTEPSAAANQSATICTFHSLCVRILRQHIEKLGYKRNFVIYDESDQLGAIKKILAHLSAKGEKLDPGELLAELSRIKNNGNREHSGILSAYARHIQPHYESALRACNAVDFDDLILLTLRLFAEHPTALEDCRGRYQYVMVDEFQDTNAAQLRLVLALTCVHRNLCVVGDDDQSIYGWRGAEISNLLDLEQHFPEVKIVKLEQNYRSTNTILKAANAIIHRNVRRRAKQLWSAKGDGSAIVLHHFEHDEEEARTVVEQIEFARRSRRARWGDFAVLFRTNSQSRPLEMAFRAEKVRYHLVGGQSFFDRREIRDFLAYLKTLINPNDEVSLLRIANVPARGLSDLTMERLLKASQERKCPVFAAMKNPAIGAGLPAAARHAVEGFVKLIEETRAQLLVGSVEGKPSWLANWAHRLMEQIGYFQELQRGEKTTEAGENRTRNLKDLIATLGEDNRPGEAPLDRLQRFVDDISLDREREEEESAGEAVTLITMHSCKGLEFPHVYIVGLEEGLLPHSRSAEEGTIDEERRLFYVALTRAMHSLSLSHCAARKKYGKLVTSRPSRFLQELPPELVEHAAERNKQPVTAEKGKSFFATLRSATD